MGPDVVLFDMILNIEFKRILFLNILLFSLLIGREVRFFPSDLLIYPIFTLGIILRPGITSLDVIISDYYNLITSHLIIKMLMYRIDHYKQVPDKLNLYIRLALVIFGTSWISYVLYPTVLYEFNDLSGHHMSVIPFSLTSSIYRLSSIQFARLSYIFDEPGTAGTFFMLLASTLMLVRGKNFLSATLTGLFSISLSYVVWIMAVFLSLPLRRSINLKAVISTLTIIIILFNLLLLYDEFYQYLKVRINSIISFSHNRSDGNGLALEMFKNSILGSSDDGWNNRIISSSGLIAMLAYKGIIFCSVYLVLYAQIFAKLFKKKMSYRGLYVFTLSMIIILLTRNNPFFASTPLMLLVSYVMITPVKR